MAIQFEFYETRNLPGEETKKYHVRAVTLRTVTTGEITRKIEESSSLTQGDVKAVLEELSKQIAECLRNSERVHLEGLGYFQPTVMSKNKIDPKKTRAQSICFKSVKFRADQQLKNRLSGSATVRADLRRHSAKLSEKEIEKKLSDFFSQHNFLTRSRMEALCNMTPTTAARHIKRLVEEGKIKNINTQRHPFYVPVEK